MIGILSTIIILLIVFLIFERKFTNTLFQNLQLEKDKLTKENDKLTKENKKIKSILDFTCYSKAIVKYSLQESKTSKQFYVLYEVTILETSTNRIKVAVIDFYTDNKVGNDPNNRVEVIRHLDNKWVDKSLAEPVIDVVKLRDLKLTEIGI